MIYNNFRECENATILINGVSVPTQDPNTLEMIYIPVEVFNGTGIFYELGASEQVARQQIQKGATGQIILDPTKVTTQINETMKVYVTTADRATQEFRMVTEKNPLNRNEAIIIDIVEN